MTQLILAISLWGVIFLPSLCEGRTSFCTGRITGKLCRFLLVFYWFYFTQCLISFASVDHLLHLCAGFLILLYYSHADWGSFCDYLRNVFKITASAASEFSDMVQVGIDVYIPHWKYQVKPYSSLWFSAAWAAAIICNYFFRLYLKDKSFESKANFRQASNHCKKILKAAKRAYSNKTKESITFQKHGSQDFWRIANSVLNKDKSAIPPLFNSPAVLSSASDKAKLFAENFSTNFNLADSGISLPVFQPGTNLKLHNISVTPKML